MAVCSLIVAILTFIWAKKIAKEQIRSEANKYLVTALVEPYNIIDTDIMLLLDGTVDKVLKKDVIDKKSLEAISVAKNYAILNNPKLFNYLNDLLSWKAHEKLGPLIDNYFKLRNKIVIELNTKKIKDKENIKNYLKENRYDEKLYSFYNVTHEFRDGTINMINHCINKKRRKVSKTEYRELLGNEAYDIK